MVPRKTLHILFYICFTFFIFALQPAHADRFTATVIRVLDGDSIQVRHEGKIKEVRLFGIDCPEYRQAFGEEARRHTRRLALRKEVTIETVGKDRHHRLLAEVKLPDGRSLNRELVRAGLAWWFRRYSEDPALKKLEEEARTKKRGLWVMPKPEPPWKFRKRTQPKR